MNKEERITTTARNWFYFSSFYAIVLLWNFVLRILQLRQQNAKFWLGKEVMTFGSIWYPRKLIEPFIVFSYKHIFLSE